mmetsp:Transcript_5530/g.13247  ORF Transcript_5530/g.13247 Transcript_5530/m.13247 type:complete len:205 (-) Transcript_5530:1267-1881(-)
MPRECRAYAPGCARRVLGWARMPRVPSRASSPRCRACGRTSTRTTLAPTMPLMPPIPARPRCTSTRWRSRPPSAAVRGRFGSPRRLPTVPTRLCRSPSPTTRSRGSSDSAFRSLFLPSAKPSSMLSLLPSSLSTSAPTPSQRTSSSKCFSVFPMSSLAVSSTPRAPSAHTRLAQAITSSPDSTFRSPFSFMSLSASLSSSCGPS